MQNADEYHLTNDCQQNLYRFQLQKKVLLPTLLTKVHDGTWNRFIEKFQGWKWRFKLLSWYESIPISFKIFRITFNETLITTWFIPELCYLYAFLVSVNTTPLWNALSAKLRTWNWCYSKNCFLVATTVIIPDKIPAPVQIIGRDQRFPNMTVTPPA